MTDVWAELDKRMNDNLLAPGECVNHPGRLVSKGDSAPSRQARKLGLCSSCRTDTVTRRQRQAELAERL